MTSPPSEPGAPEGFWRDLAATNAGRRARRFLTSDARGLVAARSTAGGAVFLLFMTRVVGMSTPEVVQGLSLGALYGILGVALVLVYRTNRIINFAAGAIGAVPAITALLLVTNHGVSFLVALPLALVGGPLVGALTDVLVMRRFAKTPRLIVTVVTIGLAQTFGILGFFIPVWLGANAVSPPQVVTPWHDVAFRNGRGQPVLNGDQVFAFVVVLALTIGLSLFLKRSRLGIALRASAENADRAALLGIPVRQVGTAAWALAGLLGSMAIFAQAPLIGVPRDASLGLTALLYALAAAVVGRMERFGVTLGAGAAIGLLIFASVSKTGTANFASALMLVVILVALLLQRGLLSRALDTGVSTWQAVKVFRPVPAELRNVPEVVRARLAGYGLFWGLAILLPFVVGQGNLTALQTLPLYGIVGISLVVLTGWAGQISLGQFGLVGFGAAAAGGLIARHNIDFFAAIAIAVAAGALAAVIIGLPAVRIQGLYLAVTTLAFGIAVHDYVLNPTYKIGKLLLPDEYHSTFQRPMLYGRIDLENERTFYFVCLIAFALSMLAALSFRRHRSGRVLIAMRDNQRAAASYAVNPVRTKLAAFAVSGAFAGLAGVLFAYAQHSVAADAYGIQNSIQVFLATCIGGLTSVWAGAGGVFAFQAFIVFGPLAWHKLLANHPTISSVIPLLVTGPLLVYNLYTAPGGLAEGVFEARDKYLRKLAARYNIHVPSLVADSRLDEQEAGSAVVHAEETAEEMEQLQHAQAGAPRLACPSCGEHLDLLTVASHEHLQVRTPEVVG